MSWLNKKLKLLGCCILSCFLVLFLIIYTKSLLTNNHSNNHSPQPISQNKNLSTATNIPPTLPPVLTNTPSPSSTVHTWTLGPGVPEDVAQTAAVAAPRWTRASAAADANVVWAWATEPDQRVAARWRYVLVAPFFILDQNASLAQVRAFWKGDAGALPPAGLRATPETIAALTVFWGPPSPATVHPTAPAELIPQTWADGHWALVPFDALEPRWKALDLDGHAPWDASYPLDLPLTVVARQPLGDLTPPGPRGNFSPDRLTVVAMTGVTALVRATAYTMEVKGLTYPAEDIGPLLATADITHISNEIPFDLDCPPPNPSQQGLKFCSDPRYIALLEAVGTDVVELTGDHFNDRGPEAVYYTVNMYRERGWQYYGGGENLDDARRPALFEHNGNRLAFVGCNAKGGGYARAAADYPGAAACDWDFLTAQVQELQQQGYLPIVTFQHEEYYVFDPPENMKADFRRMAEAGAVIVSGSQAHHPHGIAFYQGALLTYGLGNLFFDQKGITSYGDQAFIALHYFYGNRHISTRLVPIRFVDFAKPVRMTPDEARPLLESVFAVSEGP